MEKQKKHIRRVCQEHGDEKYVICGLIRQIAWMYIADNHADVIES